MLFLIISYFNFTMKLLYCLFKSIVWSIFPIFLAIQGSLVAQSYSSLVFPGNDGSLDYVGYANEGQSDSGPTYAENKMIDFSYAGYMGGGVSIPWVPVVTILEPDPNGGDDYLRIQAAINDMAATVSENSPGALLLSAGTYNVSQPLEIINSGIVIRGEGQHDGGTVVRFTATTTEDLFLFKGSAKWRNDGTVIPITDTLIPSGTNSFTVDSTSGLAVDDRLMVVRTPNQAWIELIGMDNLNATDPDGTATDWAPEAYVSNMPRIITAINGNTITIDAPVVHAIETQYGGGSVHKYDFDGAIRQVGIERIRLESVFSSEIGTDYGWKAVRFSSVENAWARQVTAKYFAYSCVSVEDESLHVTVEDCAQLEPKSEITGGKRYSFNLDDSSFILFQRCYTSEGRHDYVTGSRTVGPNVFVDCIAEQTYSDIGPHHRYSEGLLFDNVKGGEINVQNRLHSGSGHGWAGAQTVFWNCEANDFTCDAPKAAMNFAIGCIGNKNESSYNTDTVNEEFGIWESQGTHVTPRSLYYKQLEDRLGSSAVLNVVTPNQLQGTIWSDLSSWQNNDPTIVTSINETIQLTNTVVNHLAPSPPDLPMDTGWTILSQPAPGATNIDEFSNTASFNQYGTYKLAYKHLETDPNTGTVYSGFAITTVHVIKDQISTDPMDFSAIGEITDTTPALTFNTDTLEVSGDPILENSAVKGTYYPNRDGSLVAIFAFNNINLQTPPIIIGTYPIVIMSHNDITIGATVDTSGGNGIHQSHGLGRAGGGNGGDAFRRSTSEDPTDGLGIGGSPNSYIEDGAIDRPSGGGSYGGFGGDSNGGDYIIGNTYGRVYLDILCGGSGAGGTHKKGGGAGGGGIGLITKNILTIESGVQINVSGGDGAESGNLDTSGGGSGGSILLSGAEIHIYGILDASGGDGGNTLDRVPADSSDMIGGGGGGGGRIAVYYKDLLNIGNTDNITAAGGAVVGNNSNGQPGGAGTISFVGPSEKWLYYQEGITNPLPEDWSTDYNNDGLSARLEYALGGSTSTPDQSIFPTLTLNGSNDFAFTFNQRRMGIDPTDYVVETSTTLQPDDWTELPRDGASIMPHPTMQDFDRIAVSIPGNEPKLFVRLRIR